MKIMHAGALRERVIIQQRTSTPDGQGGRDVVWSTLATTWAMVEPLTGTERLQAGAETSVLSHRITMRYRADVSAVLRLVWRRRVLEIHTVASPDARREWLVLDCSQVQVSTAPFSEDFAYPDFDSLPSVA